LLRLFGMLISPSQIRWLYHVGLCICCSTRESGIMVLSLLFSMS
jgi:hypothetical protein